MKALTCITLVLFLFQFAIGQNQTASISNNHTTTASTNSTPSEIDWANFENELTDENWSFHTNQEGKLLYIDFESLGGKMNRLVLKSVEKTIIIEDNHLFDLPINTIYEVNLEKLKRGSYFVELYTYDNKIIREEITIQ
ncbi:hypothetical protein [Aureispira anguillae]|uniref:Por secretion system C-terminal sorting domain-containing protein n=1 Tax=Aureispira anguillae TaxID=2864201 RepID=A0A915YEL9_9BACT|nr:hypothetical protein [Aureispira anguillae]BDS11625.1 hypothetical protein AsAng_0023390 [Aureispira anguillae]